LQYIHLFLNLHLISWLYSLLHLASLLLLISNYLLHFIFGQKNSSLDIITYLSRYYLSIYLSYQDLFGFLREKVNTIFIFPPVVSSYFAVLVFRLNSHPL